MHGLRQTKLTDQATTRVDYKHAVSRVSKRSRTGPRTRSDSLERDCVHRLGPASARRRLAFQRPGRRNGWAESDNPEARLPLRWRSGGSVDERAMSEGSAGRVGRSAAAWTRDEVLALLRADQGSPAQ